MAKTTNSSKTAFSLHRFSLRHNTDLTVFTVWMDFPAYLLMNCAADGKATSVWMLPTFLPDNSVNDSSTKPQEVLAAVSAVLPVCQCQTSNHNCQACVCASVMVCWR